MFIYIYTYTYKHVYNIITFHERTEIKGRYMWEKGLGHVVGTLQFLEFLFKPQCHLRKHEGRVNFHAPPHMPPGLFVTLIPLRNSLEATKWSWIWCVFLDDFVWALQSWRYEASPGLTIVAILMPRPAVHLQSTKYIGRSLHLRRLASAWSLQSKACMKQKST